MIPIRRMSWLLTSPENSLSESYSEESFDRVRKDFFADANSEELKKAIFNFQSSSPNSIGRFI